MSFLDRFFGPSYEKELKTAKPIVSEINALEETVRVYDAAQLQAESDALRQRVAAGEALDTVLPQAFALVREASRRTLGERHYDVQLVGGILLHRGKITEMRTGEGKTQVGTLAAYLNALTGAGVHVVTVNDYLARRDAVWMGQIHAALGVSVGVINSGASYRYDPHHAKADAERDEHGSYKVVYEFLQPCTRREAYEADITYGTNNEFGFDYLRDNIEFDPDNLRQRGFAYAIVDEIDSILIDEARTPLIISAPAEESDNLYDLFANVARNLQAEDHFTVDEKLKSVLLTDAGIEAAEKMLGVENIYTDKGIKYVHQLENAVRAKALYTRDKEYVVRDGEVVIVDEFTGRLQPGRRWSDGLHQAIEAKEGVRVQRESKTYASVTYQNFFRMYDKLSGMTGTALTSQEEFFTVYQLEVVPVPTHRPVQRLDHHDQIFQSESGKFAAITAKVKELNATGQPVLIGTASIERNEALSTALTQAGVPHQMLNAKNHENEGAIIADAGRNGAVTLATNMAGRGVDIKLGGADANKEQSDAVRELGGLFVLGTERHEARRIDNQLRGRSGRQGDPGATQFYVSMEDSLMRVFGGERIRSLMGTFNIPEDQPIENGMITKQLEKAQTRIEGFHFDARKQVLAYDNVLNQQRQVVYERRQKLLTGSTEELQALTTELEARDPSITTTIAKKADEFGAEEWQKVYQRLALQVIDTLWVDHLELMQYTRSSVTLRAYGQRDPLMEYKKEGQRMFTEMQEAVYGRLLELIPKVEPQVIEREDEQLKAKRAAITTQTAGAAAASPSSPQRQQSDAPGRNDVVQITNGAETRSMKYKKAEPLLAAGWQLTK